MRVASDIDGTFTDQAYLDQATGTFGIAKASTMPPSEADVRWRSAVGRQPGVRQSLKVRRMQG
jgi:hypothetical protein